MHEYLIFHVLSIMDSDLLIVYSALHHSSPSLYINVYISKEASSIIQFIQPHADGFDWLFHRYNTNDNRI